MEKKQNNGSYFCVMKQNCYHNRTSLCQISLQQRLIFIVTKINLEIRFQFNLKIPANLKKAINIYLLLYPHSWSNAITIIYIIVSEIAIIISDETNIYKFFKNDPFNISAKIKLSQLREK